MDNMASMHYQNPMDMWHASPQSSAAMSMMSQPHNHPHQPGPFAMILQDAGLRDYYNATVKQLFSPAMQQQQQQNPQFYHASMACSKRFSEEEKQKLEKVFTDETQKPSTSRKRQLAEELGCPVPKVNVCQQHPSSSSFCIFVRSANMGRQNWFQNRRAREKQLHRVQAYEASQAAGLAAAENDEADDQVDQEDAVSGQPDGASQALKPSSAPFSDTDDSSEQEDPLRDLSNQIDGDVSRGSSSAPSPGGVGNKSYDSDAAEQAIHVGHQVMQLRPETSQVEMSASPAAFHVQQGIMTSSPGAYTGSDSENGTALDMFNGQLPSEFSSMPDCTDYFLTNPFAPQSTTSISHTVLVHEPSEDASARQHSEGPNFSSYDALDAPMLSENSPVMDQMDFGHAQSTSSASIASRRKTRPPQRLNQTALRNYPNGPKTGIEGSKQSDLYRTMRRAASATGPLHGKIIKSGPPLSPLSPRTFEPGFLEHIARSSSLSAASSTLKEPVTASPAMSSIEQRYLSADNSGLGYQQRSSSLSVNTFAEPLSLSPRMRQYSRENSLNGGQTPNFQHFQNPTFTLDNGCGNISPNEPLTTPGLSQFGSEMEFPTTLSAPRYVESEPATPSYVPVNLPAASTTQGQGFPTVKVESPSQGDIYPWSRSPDQLSMWNSALGQFGEPQSHTFQFQPNITPQNFNSPGQS